MKKIAELWIGNTVPFYERYGTPTLYVVQEQERYTTQYDAWCAVCHGRIQMNRLHDTDKITCPCCGKEHRRHAITYSSNHAHGMPYRIRMTVIECKKRVELRLTYSAVWLKKGVEISYHEKEVFSFHCDAHTVMWKRTGKNGVETANLGYLSDYDKMTEKTALWFFDFNHTIKKGDTFTKLLKTLRTAITRKMADMGYRKKPMYIRGTDSERLFASVLSIARKVRFWDSELVPYGGIQGMSFSLWQKAIFGNVKVEADWEQQMERLMQQNMSYIQAFLQVMHIPDSAFVRRHIRYTTLFSLQYAFSLANRDMSQQIFFYVESLRTRAMRANEWQRHASEVCEFIRLFYGMYPAMKVKSILNHWRNEYSDILYLWQKADAVTKKEFQEKHIPLKKLHDWLSVAVAKQPEREKIFAIPQNIQNTLRQSIGAYRFSCIQKNSTLRQVALTLKNCASAYRERIDEALQLVVVTDDSGTPIALLEIRNKAIIQAKLYQNSPVLKSPNINQNCLAYAKLSNLAIKTRDIAV